MFHPRQLLAFLRILLAPRADIILENVALRHQLCVLSRKRVRDMDVGLLKVPGVYAENVLS